MAIIQSRPRRSITGSRYVAYRKKKLYETGSPPTMTKLAATRRKTTRVLGGNFKQKLFSSEFVNLADPKSKKIEKVKIITVVENPANTHFVRRNILTKGTVVETEKGKARITSRPGQEGTVNAVLI